MSPRTDMTDFPDHPDDRRREIASILARGLVRLHSRRNREALSASNPEESSPTGLALAPTSRPDRANGLTPPEPVDEGPTP